MMTKVNPGVLRVSQILNFMACRAEKPCTHAEIRAGTGMSHATCHMLLTALVEVGYVIRLSDKSFILGPSLLIIVRAAEAEYSASTSIILKELPYMDNPSMR
ncbi:helix-turn-helix domain-containing protein [Novosphingobium sp. G106]|uniref:helix-turn-helix domain-containing protein n=1 Tax=Novosphingobium sp. G106 TaxID=2849500 RepID=UPI001C2D3C78|nr:helix-turn-helix domain-containing protein [Novosphingobium sp. G106]MBV1691888.1 helix-turn-helix domain-containing protein [Novosphingobium sp. G106]